MSRQFESFSKFLSLVLRHKPETIDLQLDPEGWVDLDQLIKHANAHGTQLSRPIVMEIVAINEKKRFSVTPDGSKIRANQGHSVQVDLCLAPQVPPTILFHGTATRFIASIRELGLVPGSRQHVHLSASDATAHEVGKRHGSPVVLSVSALDMHNHGYIFYQSENGVWLTATVPNQYLSFPV